MRKLSIIFFILIFQNTYAQSEMILHAGKGLGSIKISRTTEEDIKKIYGSNYQSDSSNNSYMLNYSPLGLKFHLNPQTRKVISIIAYGGFQGTTEKGIQLNKSTLKEAIKLYRHPQFVHGPGEVMYIYKGISFTAYYEPSAKYSKEAIEKLKIQEIRIGRKLKLKRPIYIE